MAVELPDPRGLKSWEDAFQYPLITTRQLERQLRADATSNKERLRSLVGASYRDLLDTAERITQIDQCMQDTESRLSSISISCNSRLVEHKLDQVQDVHAARLGEDQQKRSYGGQLMLLQKCKRVVSKLLKTRGSVLLAAKLLTLSRLLHKTLSQVDVTADILESSRKNIAALRRILLKRIDQHLASTKSSIDRLVESVCAFCLATSSSSTDAVKHFQLVRLETIKQLLEKTEAQHGNVDQAMQAYVQTLKTTRALLGRRLSDAFRSLRNRPLIQDADLQQLDELSLDVYTLCIPAEVLNFVPWIKYADMTKSEVNTFCKTWSRSAFDQFIIGLESKLKETRSIDDMMQIRRSVLHIWLESWSSIPSHDPSLILDTLRKTFNNGINSLTEAESTSINQVTTQLEKTLSSGELELAHLSLWDADFASSAVSNGAASFKDDLVRRHLGLLNDDVALSELLDSWISRIQDVQSCISQVPNMKWANIIEDEDDDESDLDEEETGDSSTSKLTVRGIERLLQSSDMETLSDAQTKSLAKAIDSLQEHLVQISDTLMNAAVETPTESTAAKSGIFIRALRTIYQRLSTSFPGTNLQKSHAVVVRHHGRLSAFVAWQIFQAPPKPRKPISMRHLWEPGTLQPGRQTNNEEDGTEDSGLGKLKALPTVPNPGIFKFLRGLVAEMATLGPDLWTGPAVTELKATIWSHLLTGNVDHILRLLPSTGMATHVNGRKADPSTEANALDLDGQHGQKPDLGNENGQMNHNDPQDTTDAKHKDEQFQAVFDYMYLQQALGPPSAALLLSSTFSFDQLKSQSALSPFDIKILEQRSREYWTRSALLFGLLLEN